MSFAIARRASVLGLALVLLVAGAASADQLEPDADTVSGVQSTVHIDAAPGSAHSLDVAFALSCVGSSRLPAGTSITVYPMAVMHPDDASMTVGDGAVHVPDAWPTGECTGAEPEATSTAAPVALTAPSAVGQYAYVVIFGLDSSSTASNTIALTVNVTVVEPPPADVTDPVLHDVPGDITVATTGTAAVVTWTGPTATDDTDPSPVVACDPPSGSSFPVGTSTVACTATDMAGNAVSATFRVTVEPAGPVLTGTWGRPLADAFPALVGQRGRTVPLKLEVRAGSTLAGPADIPPPTLRLERLAACATDALVTSAADGGAFDWSSGSWQLNLDTSGLGTGCVRMAAMAPRGPIATAVIQLVPEHLEATVSRR